MRLYSCKELLLISKKKALRFPGGIIMQRMDAAYLNSGAPWGLIVGKGGLNGNGQISFIDEFICGGLTRLYKH